jgi:hypothetical protein
LLDEFRKDLGNNPVFFAAFDSSQKRKADDMSDGQEQRGQKVNPEYVEGWEEEIDEILTPNMEIRDWEALRSQIKVDLKRKKKSLPLSQMNQLMILRNFANLRLKGYGRIEASYEIDH